MSNASKATQTTQQARPQAAEHDRRPLGIERAASREILRRRFAALAAPCIAPCVAAALLGGCAAQEPAPFDPARLQQPQRSSASSATQLRLRPLPTTLESPFVPGPGGTTRPTAPPTTGPALGVEQTVRMPLREIVQRAVMNNLDVRVEGYNPAIEATRVLEAEARFDPTFFAETNYERRKRSTAFRTVTSADGLEDTDTITAQTGLRQLTPIGGQVELRYQATRGEINNADPLTSGISANPYYESDLVLQVTQPLLRNFGSEVNNARIVINRNNQRVSLLEFRRQLEETAVEIERTYWQLVQAQQDVIVLEALLQQTLDTADVLFKRRDQDVTRVQLSQANASVEQRRSALIRAKARVRDLSDQLKRLMNDPEMPVASQTLILPASEPVAQPIHFDLKDQIDTALSNRPELGQQQLRVDSAEVARRVGKNNLLPELNVVGSVGVQGLDDDYGNAVGNQVEFDNISWGLGLQFEIPIGNREARAVYRRALLQRQQAADQYRNLIEQISLEVKVAQREVETTWQEMVANRQARFAAADALLAIQQRQDAGEALTPTFVQLKLDTQERLSDANQRENASVANYNIAIARLEQTKGTLLRYNNILMEEDKLPLARR